MPVSLPVPGHGDALHGRVQRQAPLQPRVQHPQHGLLAGRVLARRRLPQPALGSQRNLRERRQRAAGSPSRGFCRDPRDLGGIGRWVWGAGSASPGRAVLRPCQPLRGSPWGKSHVDPTRSRWDPARSSSALSRFPCDAAASTITHWLSISRDPAGISTEPRDDLTPSWQRSSKVAAPTSRYRSTPYESTAQVHPALSGSPGIQRVSQSWERTRACQANPRHRHPLPELRHRVDPTPGRSHVIQHRVDPAASGSRCEQIPADLPGAGLGGSRRRETPGRSQRAAIQERRSPRGCG